MPEARSLPLHRWGEEIRRERDARRAQRSRTAVAAIAACLVTALIASMLWPPRPLLVWNASASAPIGLYRVVAPTDVRTGDMVVAWTPEPARTLAARRRYLPSNIPLVKRVAAAAGDRVCAAGESVWVDDRHVARRRTADGAGRAMPLWTGCRDLRPGEYFLLTEHPDSFDGRYFGVTPSKDIVGKAWLLWAR